MTERRRDQRMTTGDVRVRIRPGHRLTLMNVSARGALLEGACALRPGSQVEVLLDTPTGAKTIAGRVNRCVVAAIHPLMTYRAAVAFSQIVPAVREWTTRCGYVLHESREEPAAQSMCVVAALPEDDEASGK
jgi:hypothetical protein